MLGKRALRRLLLSMTGHFVPATVHNGGTVGAQKVLLIRPDHLGDVLFTIPALRALRQAYPRAHITYMVGEWAEDVVRAIPYVDDVISCRFPGFTRQPKGSPLAPYRLLISEARRLRQLRFDTAVVLRFDFWWGAMLARFAGIARRIGYSIPESKPFLTEAIDYVPGRHEVEQNIALLSQCFDIPAGEPEGLEFHQSPEDEARAAARLGGVGDAEFIAIHPGAGAPVKLWRTEALAQVADAVTERHGARIIVTGSPAERALVEAVAGSMRSPALTVTDAGVGELAAVLKHCRLVVGPDCGVLHLAVAVGSPTVHLYGPVSHVTFGPWGDPMRHVVVRAEPACVACNRLDHRLEELPEHSCVRAITPAQVLSAVDLVLNEVAVAHRN